MSKELKYGKRLSNNSIGLLSSKLKKQLNDKYNKTIKFSVRKFFNAGSFTGINVRFNEHNITDNILDDIYLYLKTFAEKNAPILIRINGFKMFDSNYPSIFVNYRITSILDVSMYVKNINDKIKVLKSDRSIDGLGGIVKNNKILKRYENASCNWINCFKNPYDE